MRHRVAGKKLKRDHQHRQALFTNLVSGLIEHGSVETTLPKAKAVKGLVDKLMTKAKKGDMVSRRLIAKSLKKRALVNRLVDELAPKTGKRTSGFTRIIRLGARRGDAAMTARISFVDQVIAPKAAPAKEEAKKAQQADKKAEAKPATKQNAASVSARKTTKPVMAKPAPAAKVAKKRGDK